MNESNEPSYYEIALTNRQVLVAFVVLLLSVLAAFVGGVWLGRGGAEPAEPAAVIAEEELPSDVEALEELTFFSEEGQTAAATPPPPLPPPPERTQPASPPAESTLAEDLGVEQSPPPPARSAPPPRPAPPPPRPAAASSSGPGFVIQVFSGRDEQQARVILDKLEKDGKKAFLSPVAVGSLTMYRVRVGPFGDRAKADREATEITRKHKLDTWITAVDN